jgi:ribosomal protein S6E (S10)
LTEDSKRKIREDAEAAEDDLPKRIGDVVDAGDELDVTFNAEIDKLRMKIRGIDDLIVRDQLT